MKPPSKELVEAIFSIASKWTGSAYTRTILAEEILALIRAALCEWEYNLTTDQTALAELILMAGDMFPSASAQAELMRVNGPIAPGERYN